MKRMRILGLALVAVFALAAVAASGASAAPTWNACVKAEPKNTGKYTEKLCATESAGGNTGKYNLVAGIGKGKGFKTKGGEAKLVVVVPPTEKGPFGGGATLEVKCTSFKGAGSIGMPNTVSKVKDTFKGCSVLGAAPCQNGTKKGVIETNNLSGELVDIEGGTGVGTLLHAEEGPVNAEFECTGVGSNVVTGSLIGIHGPVGTVGKESTDTFVIGPGLGEVEFAPGKKYTPLVNLPTHISGGFNGEHFLVATVTEAGEKEPAGSLPSGQVGVANNKGESLEVLP